MIPVGDSDVRGASVPIVSWAFIALNALVFVYQLTLGESGLQQFFMQFGVVPSEIQAGDNLLSLLTSIVPPVNCHSASTAG